MKSILTIAKRELGAYFNSPVAYIVITAFLLITGPFFFDHLFQHGQASMRYFFSSTPWLFIVLLPALTMRLFAEEKRSKTIELLITLPLSDWQVVWGKFIGALGVLVVALLLSLTYAFTIASLGDLDWGITIAGYIGTFLLGALYIAIGMMASSWTRHQVSALLITVGITFFLFIAGFFSERMPPLVADLAAYISPHAHAASIARGILDTRDIVYYFSLIGVCLFLTKQSLDSRRWR